jgi:hypothetical protein
MSIHLPVGPLHWIASYGNVLYTGTLQIGTDLTVQFTCQGFTAPVTATCSLNQNTGLLMVTTNFYFGSALPISPGPRQITGTLWSGTLVKSAAAASGVQLTGLVMSSPGGIDTRPNIAYWSAGMSRNIFMGGSKVPGPTVTFLVNPYPPTQGMEGLAVFTDSGNKQVSLPATQGPGGTTTISQPNSVQLNISGHIYTTVEGTFNGQHWSGHFHPQYISRKKGGDGDNWGSQSAVKK